MNSAPSACWSTPRFNRFRAVLIAASGALLGLAAVTWNTSTAAQPPNAGPPINLDEPVAVTVSGPVEVQGSIEVVNDALKAPFRYTETFSLADGTTARVVAVTLPAGKRLVIETAVASASLPAGQNALASVNLPGGHNAFLAVQSQGNFGGQTFFVGTHPITLRINTTETPSLNLEVGRSGGVGSGIFKISVFGYTEDL